MFITMVVIPTSGVCRHYMLKVNQILNVSQPMLPIWFNMQVQQVLVMSTTFANRKIEEIESVHIFYKLHCDCKSNDQSMVECK